ncbi:hypothetical protein [Streptomyces malaysiensis]|uniref:hypothetical protein n=1 Tax=Streptomyces malaysiensis TaxID=92644 RepID=UPI002B307BCF|nr:hypothetical protein R8789_44505 [Streptomyces malaysiensis]
MQVEYNGSVYSGWQSPISEAPELVGLVIAFVILMITFGASAAAGMPTMSPTLISRVSTWRVDSPTAASAPAAADKSVRVP